MKKIVTCQEMKAIDAATMEEYGLPSCVLMERAALAVEEELYPILKPSDRILVACGSGNNGGDGFAAARLLHQKGYDVTAWFLGNPAHLTPECRRQREIAAKHGVPELAEPNPSEYTVLVDAIFGVGLTRPVEGSYAEAIQAMNAADAFRVAVDLPSGLNGDTGMILGTAFLADLTVTFAFRKRGMCLYPGQELCGRTVVADIGIYDWKNQVTAAAMEAEDLRSLPKRSTGGNKGTFGKVLLLAGSEGMCGAAYLSACAALHTGCGMVQILTAEANRIPLQMLLPEAILSTDFSEENLKRLLAWADVLVCGPGLSQSPEALQHLRCLLEADQTARLPLILDADGLNLLAANSDLREFLGDHVICTPHLGELSRLTGVSIAKLKENLPDFAQRIAFTLGCVVVCKDACTVIAAPDQKLYFNLSGNDGMATAGSGDVLSGILAGICCSYLAAPSHPSYEAALGVWLHGAAGDLAACKRGRHGMTARDLTEQIPDVLRSLAEAPLPQRGTNIQ